MKKILIVLRRIIKNNQEWKKQISNSKELSVCWLDSCRDRNTILGVIKTEMPGNRAPLWGIQFPFFTSYIFLWQSEGVFKIKIPRGFRYFELRQAGGGEGSMLKTSKMALPNIWHSRNDKISTPLNPLNPFNAAECNKEIFDGLSLPVDPITLRAGVVRDWEISKGKTMLYLDDELPLSKSYGLAKSGNRLLISHDAGTTVYYLGANHPAWANIKKGEISLELGGNYWDWAGRHSIDKSMLKIKDNEI